ncbi:MAG: DUF4350 domain-containing protein [Gammaproteobacteria bacterium]|nr:DUF4350 domain-containing protein [Gammaproteobacteria bacterium]
MIRTRTSPLAVLGVILLALVIWGLYSSIEFYNETEHSGWSRKALYNPYLAAQTFMSDSGIGVTDVDTLVKLEQLDDVGTLFFSDANQVQTPRQLKQLMDWLEVGGNVIYSADSVSHDDDLLLSEFGVEVDWSETEDDAEADGEESSLSETLRDYNRQIEEGKSREEIARETGKPEEALTQVAFDDDIGEIEVAFDTSRVLQHAFFDDTDDAGLHQPLSWSSSNYGVHMMQFEVGDGLLTIVSDPGIWTSYHIDQYDNAYLLWLLSSDDGNFAILRSVLHDSIWVLMKRNASELLIATGLFIVMMVWHLACRFGRMLPRDLSRTRALGEHFSSVSHYLWHRRNAEYLLAPLRQAVLRRASLTLGEFARADQLRQFELIAERCDLNRDAIARAFSIDDFNEASFVQTVRLLKRIEQLL